MNELSLEAIGIAEGTDKWSQDYLRHYERAFAPFREQEFTLIEIGVFNGSSVRMWARFFPKATVVGIDINPHSLAFAADRIIIEIGSQVDPEFLAGLTKKYSPSIIIDDGSHMADDVLFTFDRLFPAMLPGGCYVMEDLFFHSDNYFARRVGAAKTLPKDVVATFCRNLMDGDRQVEGEHGVTRYYRASIDRVEIIRKAALIWKTSSVAYDLKEMQKFVELSPNPTTWDEFARVVENQTKDAQLTANVVLAGLERYPKNWRAFRELARLLFKVNDFKGALEAAEAALKLAPETAHSQLESIKRDASAKLGRQS
jgi:hypothetical protein